MTDELNRTERGWAGHFIGAHQCKFRRNTLLELGDVRIVVSAVGAMELQIGQTRKCPYEEVGYKRYFETMVFRAQP